jgi:peptidoglycan/LPS O-acetylase OafA/YrhL
MESTNRTFISALDQLRGLAFLLVATYHGLQLFGAELAHARPFDPHRDWIISMNPFVAIIEEGHTGVGAFITLSGFILSLGVMGKRYSVSGFLIARALRIYPMLLVCTIIAALSIAALPGPSKLSRVLLTLLPFNAPGGIINAFTALFWAVRVELQCYIAFPLLMWLGAKRGNRALVPVVVAMILLRVVLVGLGWASARDLSYWTFWGRIDQFCIGMMSARLFNEGWRPPVPVLVPLVAVGCVLVAFNQLGGWPVDAGWKAIWPDLEALLWGSVIIVAANASTWRTMFGRILGWIGEISYSAYLLHFAIIATIVKYNLMFRATGNPIADALLTTVLMAIPLTLIAGATGFYVVERPALRRRPRYVSDGARASA